MKFAVIEYSSKSGDIWKHTPDRPNYLADPQKEMDPTSFGCYVSALEGEHIPLLGLIKPSMAKKAIKRLTGKWPQSYSIDYLKQFDVLMVVHQLSDAHEMVALLKRIAELPKRPFVIGVPTQPYGILRARVDEHPRKKEELVDFMNRCDVFLSVVKSTVHWYAEMTKTPVVYVPQPYPAAFAAQCYKDRDQKEKTILVAGVTQRDNILQGQLAARQLQKEFPDYSILVPKVADMEYDFTNLEGSKYSVLPFEQWQTHLQTISKASLVINTDFTQTRGRVQTDCAAVGTPSLGGNSDAEVDLFPQLQSKPDTPLETVVAKGKHLLSDEKYYKETATYARENLRKYDYEESAARITALVKTYAIK